MRLFIEYKAREKGKTQQERQGQRFGGRYLFFLKIALSIERYVKHYQVHGSLRSGLLKVGVTVWL